MARVEVKGKIIPNDYKFYFDYWKEDSCCPRDIQDVIDKLGPGEELDVMINSPGGVIDAGMEIYTTLRELKNHKVNIHITGCAHSAASIIAMASKSEMTPVGLMMVHCVSASGYMRGNHKAFEHQAEVLETADNALCTAYMAKTGMSREETIDMMERETWLTAEQAKEKGLIDEIMFNDQPMAYTNAAEFALPTKEQLEAVRNKMNEEVPEEKQDQLENIEDWEALEAELSILELENAGGNIE